MSINTTKMSFSTALKEIIKSLILTMKENTVVQ